MTTLADVNIITDSMSTSLQTHVKFITNRCQSHYKPMSKSLHMFQKFRSVKGLSSNQIRVINLTSANPMAIHSLYAYLILFHQPSIQSNRIRQVQSDWFNQSNQWVSFHLLFNRTHRQLLINSSSNQINDVNQSSTNPMAKLSIGELIVF